MTLEQTVVRIANSVDVRKASQPSDVLAELYSENARPARFIAVKYGLRIFLSA